MLLDKSLLVTETNGGVFKVQGFGASKIFVTLPATAAKATLTVETSDTLTAGDLTSANKETLVATANASASDLRLGVFAISMPAAVKEYIKITPEVLDSSEEAVEGFVCGIAPVYEQEGYIEPTLAAERIK